MSFSKLLVLACVLGAGCQLVDDRLSRKTQSLSTYNELDYNRLVYNRLVYNRLVYNRLVYNRLVYNRLGRGDLVFSSSDGVETTEEGRELLQYVVRCALPADEVMVVEHGRERYEFPGLLGVAPEWKDGPLDDSKIRLMSACLLAHVNAFGVSVPISIRSFGVIGATEQELVDYPVYEATFFGDVFGDELRAYACRGTQLDIATALSSFREDRVCADGTGDCGIESVGYCRDVCETRVGSYGWTDCWAHGVRYSETASTYLAYDSDSDRNRACDRRRCNLDSYGDDAVLSCAGASSCDLKCVGDARCLLDGADTNHINAIVGGATAEIDCYGTTDCEATCGGWWNTACTIDCKDAKNCSQVRCKDGATCLLDCTGAESCGFRRCDGPVVACPGDIWVCNGSCPTDPAI